MVPGGGRILLVMDSDSHRVKAWATGSDGVKALMVPCGPRYGRGVEASMVLCRVYALVTGNPRHRRSVTAPLIPFGGCCKWGAAADDVFVLC